MYDTLNPYDSHKAHKYLVEGRKQAFPALGLKQGEWIHFFVYATNRTQAAHVAKALGWEVGSMSMEG